MNLRERLTSAWSVVRFGAQREASPLTDPAGDWSGILFGGPELAYRSSVAIACIQRISGTVATLPFQVYRRTADGREVAADHWLRYLLHTAPNPELTSVEWKAGVMRDLLVHGNHFSKYTMAGNGEVVSIEPLAPSSVIVERDAESRRKRFWVMRDGRREPFTDNEILHIPAFGYDGLVGYSPLSYSMQPVTLAINAESYGGEYFRHDAIPNKYVSVPGTLTELQRKALEKYLQESYGHGKRHMPGIFEAGAEPKALTNDHQKLQFLELRRFQAEEIARVFGVPPHLVGILDRATNNNIEHQAIDYVMHTILPWLRIIEARVNMTLLGPIEGKRYFAEFNVEGLLRGDSTSRAAFYASAVNNAWMTPNEVRAKENLDPMPGGDGLYIQGATVPLDMAGRPAEKGVQP